MRELTEKEHKERRRSLVRYPFPMVEVALRIGCYHDYLSENVNRQEYLSYRFSSADSASRAGVDPTDGGAVDVQEKRMTAVEMPILWRHWLQTIVFVSEDCAMNVDA